MDEKIYEIYNAKYDINTNLNIKEILLFNYKTKKLLKKHDIDVFYIGSNIYTKTSPDIIAEFLLLYSDGTIGFKKVISDSS